MRTLGNLPDRVGRLRVGAERVWKLMMLSIRAWGRIGGGGGGGGEDLAELESLLLEVHIVAHCLCQLQLRRGRHLHGGWGWWSVLTHTLPFPRPPFIDPPLSRCNFLVKDPGTPGGIWRGGMFTKACKRITHMAPAGMWCQGEAQPGGMEREGGPHHLHHRDSLRDLGCLPGS